jgi:hypothetical protein
VGVYFKLFTVARIHLPTTLLLLLRPLPCVAAVVAACRHYDCGEKNIGQQYYIFFLYFALAIMIVSLTANAIRTMMATAPAMIYCIVCFMTAMRIVAIKYFSFYDEGNKQRKRRRLLLFLRWQWQWLC